MKTKTKRTIAFLILCTIFLLSANESLSQSPNNNPTENFVYEDISAIKEVTFYSPTYPSTDGWVRMKNDDQTPVSNEVNKTIAWEITDNEIQTKPITFVSGNTGKVSAKFIRANCNLDSNPDVIYIKGTNSEGFNLPTSQAITSNNDDFIEYSINDFELSFADNTVNYFEALKIEWFAAPSSDTPDDEWISIGETVHEIYIVFDTPNSHWGGGFAGLTEPFHTVIHLGCVNAKGLTEENSIVDAIYSEFMDRDVRKYGGTAPMTYWGPPIPPGNPEFCFFTWGLLEHEDGRCAAWAYFLYDIINMQGIEGTELVAVDWNNVLSEEDDDRLNDDASDFFSGTIPQQVVSIEAISPTDVDGKLAELLVNTWSITDSDKFVIGEEDQMGSSISLINDNLIPQREETGIPAQGIQDPKSEFRNHVIVKYNGDFYDPSYGTIKKESENAWEISSLHAFTAKLDITIIEGDVEVVRRILWVSELNTPEQQTNFDIID